jgi:hypothetical protein
MNMRIFFKKLREIEKKVKDNSNFLIIYIQLEWV